MSTSWTTEVLSPGCDAEGKALIILNQPFTRPLLERLWHNTSWRSCADGGANRLYDCLENQPSQLSYLPNLIKGDLDSIRTDVRQYYASHNVEIEEAPDQYSTDLMKCVQAIPENIQQVYLLGGLSGRLDQTVHTLSYMHKLRKSHITVFVVTDDNIAWIVSEGEHTISIDHASVGPTCGILPIGIASSIVSMKGLRWDLTDVEFSFDGMVSSSNQFLPEIDTVWIKTTAPVWWTAELRAL